MYFDIIKANYVEDYKIELFFENNKKGIVDLKEYVGNKDVFTPFEDIAFLKNLK